MLVAIAVVLITIANTHISKKTVNNTSKAITADSVLNQQKEQNIADIDDNISNAYALLAAKRVDVCPKLLQKDIDNNVIERTAEVMTTDHCDYFMYLNVGQHIDVMPSDKRLEALLIVPTIHNFAEGDYLVTSYDKHVIRLAYDGIARMPKRLDYDVTIIVTD